MHSPGYLNVSRGFYQARQPGANSWYEVVTKLVGEQSSSLLEVSQTRFTFPGLYSTIFSSEREGD